MSDASTTELSGGAQFRSMAMSAVLAAQARALPDVIEFHREVLGGKLIAQDEIAAWVREHSEPDPTWDPLDAVPRSEQLEYPVEYPGKGVWRGIKRVREGQGHLGRLKAVASQLEEAFGWQEPHAVAFILTDAIPRISITGELQVHSAFRSYRTDLRLTIPIWASETDVIAAYRRLRKEFHDFGYPRLGPMSERMADLLRFTYTRLDPSGKPAETWERIRQDGTSGSRRSTQNGSTRPGRASTAPSAELRGQRWGPARPRQRGALLYGKMGVPVCCPHNETHKVRSLT